MDVLLWMKICGKTTDEMGRQYWEGHKRTDETSGTRTSGGELPKKPGHDVNCHI